MCFCCTEVCLHKTHHGADNLECHHMAHVQDNQGIRPSQHRFMKGECCLANLVFFYESVTSLVWMRERLWCCMSALQ